MAGALVDARPLTSQRSLAYELGGRADWLVLTSPAGDRTRVDWVMHGELNPLMRAFSFFKSMDSMMGPDFERGLAQLKRVTEASATA